MKAKQKIKKVVKSNSKREQYAAMALQGLLANPKNTKHRSNIFIRFFQLFNTDIGLEWSSSNQDQLVSSAYRYADEIIKQSKTK